MKYIIVLTAVILTANALSSKELWQSFKREHNKSFAHVLEEKHRFSIFQSNLKRIEEHNAKYARGEESYYMGVTKFADITAEEFMSMISSQIKNKPDIEAIPAELPNVAIPESVDWRESGAVLEVKDQGQCGSCWAFSTTGALEGLNYLKNKIAIPLSEQELMDCSVLYENYGCNGGDMKSAFRFVKSHGLTSSELYPYQAKQETCKTNLTQTVIKINGYKVVESNEDSLKQAIATVGPISIGMEATKNLQLYKGGILHDTACKNVRANMNHGVLAVGYGSENGTDYFIVKNSWGTSWGEKGFFRIKGNPSTCCITCDASYPTLP